ncbi:zinc finger protein 8-like [Lolium rigidum]|uniref:zinc finger protein 8-like n=1 Tax=Lolium rigidum TaxID=89674 RepID=UPI001F5E0BEA|nr:zinc finger protein 8-like [Lolium rigidum]
MATKQEVRTVDAFSQLPFIRPASAHPQRQAPVDTTIRLFGREFSNTDGPQHPPQRKQDGSGSPDVANGSTVTSEANGGPGAATAGEASRKFECHYCCRNFPTSQALGGHQNAHKRERQHAKRAHLQASLAMHRYVPGHMYGALLGYHHHLAGRYDHHHQLPPPHYPMWSTAAAGVPGPYGGPGSVSQPIDGSPVVQGLWRAPQPANTQSFGAATPVTAMRPAVEVVTSCKDDQQTVAMSLLPSSPSFSSCSSTSPEKLGRCELGQQQEALSLDLHL